MAIPDRKYLESLLRLDQATGRLYWRDRPSDLRWSARYAGREAFTAVARKGYRVGLIDGKQYKAHRIVFVMAFGFEPDVVDHINRDTSDNRPLNLRSVSLTQNAQNRGIMRTNTSGFFGVYKSRSGKWYASIRRDGLKRQIGPFPTPDIAMAAREAALA